MWSAEREIQLGEELAREMGPTLFLYDDPVVTAYVQEIADRIVRNSDLRVPLRVSVVDSSAPNAFALPGGHFYINTGMILEARTEAELAAIISHEAAHVGARHATRQMTRGRIFDLISIPLVFVGGPVAYGVSQGLALGGPLSMLKFSRDSEREADFLGLQYHARSGYDPVAFVDFFERMRGQIKDKEKESGITQIFSTHPMTKDRIKAAQETISTVLPRNDSYVISTSRFDQVHEHLAQKLGEKQRSEGKSEPVLRKRTGEIQGKKQP